MVMFTSEPWAVAQSVFMVTAIALVPYLVIRGLFIVVEWRRNIRAMRERIDRAMADYFAKPGRP